MQINWKKKMNNPTPNLFYDRPQDARSSRALHPTREGERKQEEERRKEEERGGKERRANGGGAHRTTRTAPTREGDTERHFSSANIGGYKKKGKCRTGNGERKEKRQKKEGFGTKFVGDKREENA